MTVKKKGFPDDSPETSSYFQHPLHTKDQYSISFSVIFKEPVNGNNLLFGNDLDRPIRDRLPPGFNTALHLVKRTIDPAIEGDAYADNPYLYSPALATWNQFAIGEKIQKSDNLPKGHKAVVVEGAEGEEATTIREELNIPNTAAARQKHFLDETNRKNFDFEPGRIYSADFGNPYLGFSGESQRTVYLLSLSVIG